MRDVAATLIYLHGFLSSPQSSKAQLLGRWLEKNHPELEFCCPFLKPYPIETEKALTTLIAERHSKRLYLVGSSMGGYWATWLAEKYNLPAVLVNPAIDVSFLDSRYIGVPLKNYHYPEQYQLTSEDVLGLQRYQVPNLNRLGNYWLLLQTGDDVLDYRLAEEKYAGTKQTIEQGGDHGFQGFERYFVEIMAFFAGF